MKAATLGDLVLQQLQLAVASLSQRPLGAAVAEAFLIRGGELLGGPIFASERLGGLGATCWTNALNAWCGVEWNAGGNKGKKARLRTD